MDRTNAQAFFPFFPRICSVGNTGSRISVVVVFFGDDAVLFWERERERMSVDFTHRGRWRGRGGEGRDAKKKKKKTTYPPSEYGRWQHCGKEEGGEDGSLHFGFLFFSFSSLGKLLFLLSLLMEMNR